jgi:hypothetical protein
MKITRGRFSCRLLQKLNARTLRLGKLALFTELTTWGRRMPEALGFHVQIAGGCKVELFRIFYWPRLGRQDGATPLSHRRAARRQTEGSNE